MILIINLIVNLETKYKRSIEFLHLYLLIPILLFLVILPQAQSNEIITLAILDFKNVTNSKDVDWLSSGFSETLTSRLTKNKYLQIIDRKRIKNTLEELSFSQSGFVDSSSAPKIGQIIGVKYILTGSYQIFQSKILINAQITDVESTKIIDTVSMEGKFSDVLNLQKKLSDNVVKNIQKSLLKPSETDTSTDSTKSLSSFELFSKGLLLYDQKNYSSAIKLFKQSLLEDKNFIEAHRYFEYSSREAKMLDDYVQFYKDSISKEPKNYIFYNFLGNGYFDLNDLKNAKDCYENSIKLNPKFASSYSNLGILFAIAKDYSKAIINLEKSLKLEPNDSKVIYNLGLAYKQKGNKDKSTQYFKKALQSDPANPSFNIARKEIYGKNLVIKSKNLKIPGSEIGEVLINGGVIFQIKDNLGGYTNLERAAIVATRLQKLLGKGLESSQVKSGIMNGQSVVMTHNNELVVTLSPELAKRENTMESDVAEAWSNKLSLILDKSSGDISTDQGYILRGNKNIDENAVSHLHKGDNYYSEGNIEMAISEYESAISLDSTFSSAYYSLGEIYLEQQSYSKAKESFENAVKISSDYSDAYVGLGKYYYFLNEKDNAQIQFKKALEYNKNNPEASKWIKKLNM